MEARRKHFNDTMREWWTLRLELCADGPVDMGENRYYTKRSLHKDCKHKRGPDRKPAREELNTWVEWDGTGPLGRSSKKCRGITLRQPMRGARHHGYTRVDCRADAPAAEAGRSPVGQTTLQACEATAQRVRASTRAVSRGTGPRAPGRSAERSPAGGEGDPTGAGGEALRGTASAADAL